MGISKTGILSTEAIHEIITLSDGSKWAPIAYHNIKKGSNLFSSSDDFTKYVYHNDECWCNFPLIGKVNRPDSSKYEIMVAQQPSGSEDFKIYRWTQTVSPLTATWSQVNPSSGNIVHSGASASYGGMYILNSTVYMCFANGSNGNWFGCAHKTLWGGTAGTTGYVPGYNGESVSQWQAVYIRIADWDAQIYENMIIGNELIEI